MALSASALKKVTDYWARTLGVSSINPQKGIILAPPTVASFLNLLMFEGSLVISGPRSALDAIQTSPYAKSQTSLFSREALSEIFSDSNSDVLGPAYLGYSDTPQINLNDMTKPISLDADVKALDQFREAVGEVDWEAGGIEPSTHSLLGIFQNNEIAAIGGYDIWDGTLAHICILTHPQYRGNGCGKIVTRALMARADSKGLISQYRTLLSNRPSLIVAEALGFQSFGTSMAVKL